MRVLLLAAVALPLAAGCGGPEMAKVKGRLVENGAPREVAGGSVGVQLTLIGEGGKLDPKKSYTAVVNTDGTFEVVASGGELQPGTYQVALQFKDPKDKLASQVKAVSGGNDIRREIKPGPNELTIDLLKPGG